MMLTLCIILAVAVVLLLGVVVGLVFILNDFGKGFGIIAETTKELLPLLEEHKSPRTKVQESIDLVQSL